MMMVLMTMPAGCDGYARYQQSHNVINIKAPLRAPLLVITHYYKIKGEPGFTPKKRRIVMVVTRIVIASTVTSTSTSAANVHYDCWWYLLGFWSSWLYQNNHDPQHLHIQSHHHYHHYHNPWWCFFTWIVIWSVVTADTDALYFLITSCNRTRKPGFVFSVCILLSYKSFFFSWFSQKPNLQFLLHLLQMGTQIRLFPSQSEIFNVWHYCPVHHHRRRRHQCHCQPSWCSTSGSSRPGLPCPCSRPQAAPRCSPIKIGPRGGEEDDADVDGVDGNDEEPGHPPAPARHSVALSLQPFEQTPRPRAETRFGWC